VQYGTRLRVTLRLIRASDGLAVWAGSFDSDVADPTSRAADVAREATAAIRSAILGSRDHADTTR
jgi:TolB-like protein